MPGRSRPTGDEGLTLVEVMISTVVAAATLGLFSASMTLMFRSSGSIAALETVQTDFRLATVRLDKEIRFASAIGVPGAVAGDANNWHVAFATTTGTCVELRLDATTGRLQRREPASGATWSTLASGVTGGEPFGNKVVTDTSGHQQLTLTVVLTAGGDRDKAERTKTVTFAALNSSADSLLPAGCAVAA